MRAYLSLIIRNNELTRDSWRLLFTACVIATLCGTAGAETVRNVVDGRLHAQQVITRRATQLGVDPKSVATKNLATGILTPQELADVQPGNPVVLVKARVLRPKSESQVQHRPSFHKGQSSLQTRTVYAMCMGINEWVGHTYCAYPYPSGLTIVAYGRNLFGHSDTIYHRFGCEMAADGYVNYTNPYDGWDGSSYCPWGATVGSIDNGFDYLGYIRFGSYGRSIGQADQLRRDTHYRYGVSDSCQGPSYPGAPHQCGASVYDLIWALPRPTYYPSHSNSDCWFKRYVTQFTYGVVPPVTSPCWVG